jgi:dolichol-phosphate mannosyltransferase
MLSAVVPMYNESENVQAFVTLLLDEYSDFGEVVLVNDGSNDDTLAKMKVTARTYEGRNTKIRIISLSRNFGKEAATSAGLAVVKGDAVVILDGDGQHPPQLIKQFVKKWQQGAQVVVGVRKSNKTASVFKKLGSKLYYSLFNSGSSKKMIPGQTDFVLLDREVIDQFNKLPEKDRMVRGLIDWLGYNRDFIEYDADARLGGKPTYSTKKLINLALNSITSLSVRPLLAIIWLGVFVTFVAFLLDAFLIIEKYILNDPFDWNISGAAILSVSVTLLVGILISCQGVISLYLSSIHHNSQGRPLYVINERDSVL